MSTLDIRTIADTQDNRDLGNALLRRFHNVKNAIVPIEKENRVREVFPGLPRLISVGAFHGDELVGAATAWLAIESLNFVAQGYGQEFMERWCRRWRLFTHIAVLRDLRGQGVGTALVRELERLAADDGAKGMYGLAEDMPAPSWPFYKALGYRITPSDVPAIIGGVETMQDPAKHRTGMTFLRLLSQPTLSAAGPND